MSDPQDGDEIYWYDPEQRGVMPLDGFHLSKSLAKTIRKSYWQIEVDRDFPAVLRACADRPETWISPKIMALYEALHRMGFAHSVEVYEQDQLVGGLYGVSLGAAFFGESMFSYRTDASKLALAYLVHRLRAGGYQLLDMQYLTDHLARLGGIEISRRDYRKMLKAALSREASFTPEGYSPSSSEVGSSSTSSGRLVVSGGE